MPSATVRLLCEARSQSRTVRDAATAERPFYWRGSSVIFELALADRGAYLLADGVGTIVVEVKRLNALALDDALMRKEYVADDCDDTFASNDWDAGTKALLSAAFDLNEAAILPGTYRLIVRHLGDDGSELVHLSTELQVLDPQSGSEGIDPPPVAWTYLDGLPLVRTDSDQGLSSGEQLQARANIGAPAATDTVLFTPADPANGSRQRTARQAIGITRTADGLPADGRCDIVITGITGWVDTNPNATWIPAGLTVHSRPTWRLAAFDLLTLISRNSSGYWEMDIQGNTWLRSTTANLDFPWQAVAWTVIEAGLAGAALLNPSELPNDYIPLEFIPPEILALLVGLTSNSTSGVRLVLNSSGGYELALWNSTASAYQAFRLVGSGSSRTLDFITVP